MVSRKKVTISWSGGKDSAFALHKILQEDRFDVVSLHTTFNKQSSRVGFHGVHEHLIEQQAKALGLPLIKVYLEESDELMLFESLMKELYAQFVRDGISHIVFGDIFLDDLRNYREGLLKHSGLKPIFPLWKETSDVLLENFIRKGFKTVVCASNEMCYAAGLLGRTIDEEFRKNIPVNTDPCGENGEFHTFVYDAPIFSGPISFRQGETVVRKYQYSIKDGDAVVPMESIFYFRELSL